MPGIYTGPSDNAGMVNSPDMTFNVFAGGLEGCLYMKVTCTGYYSAAIIVKKVNGGNITVKHFVSVILSLWFYLQFMGQSAAFSFFFFEEFQSMRKFKVSDLMQIECILHIFQVLTSWKTGSLGSLSICQITIIMALFWWSSILKKTISPTNCYFSVGRNSWELIWQRITMQFQLNRIQGETEQSIVTSNGTFFCYAYGWQAEYGVQDPGNALMNNELRCEGFLSANPFDSFFQLILSDHFWELSNPF